MWSRGSRVSTSGSGLVGRMPPTHQADAVLAQAAPVQNTYYPILNTTSNCRVLAIFGMVADTGETLQLRLTIDGQVIENTAAAVPANTYFEAVHFVGGVIEWTTIDTGARYRAFLIEGKSVKVEIRKTTIAGAGNLNGRVRYQKW